MIPLPPTGLPPGLYDIEREVREQIEPTKPHRVCVLASAAMPDAADWNGCMVWVSDIATIAVSDGTNWLRSDTGASI